MGNVSATILTQQFEYKNYRLLAKAGIGANFDPLTVGVSLATPSLSLSGSGSSLVNLINTGDASSDETIFIANYQQEVSARHNLPLSVGFGAGYRLGKHRLHIKAEWYDKVDRYDILDAEAFIDQSSGETFSNQVDSEFKSVFNYGFGVEFYISYITDFSAAVLDTRTNLTVSTTDIYHFSIGASISIGRSEFTLGINYAFGSDEVRGPVNLPESDIKNALGDLLQNSDVDYNRLKFLIGFSIEI